MKEENFNLNEVFRKNVREYQTRPVMAAKYGAGMETGFAVYFSNKADGKREAMQYEGIRIFKTEPEALGYAKAGHKQYIRENGELVGIAAEYGELWPVLHKLINGTGKRAGIDFGFGNNAFLSDESGQYDIFILENNCWIIQGLDGSIRVWYPDSEETFFGGEKDIVFEKIGNGDCCDYVQVAV